MSLVGWTGALGRMRHPWGRVPPSNPDELSELSLYIYLSLIVHRSSCLGVLNPATYSIPVPAYAVGDFGDAKSLQMQCYRLGLLQ